MQDRVKMVRKSLDLSQEAFGRALGVTKTAICGIEAGRRGLTEQMALSICREFNVNYDWLKEGSGEMFDAVPETLVDELSHEFQLDDLDKRIILGYLRLSETDRAAIKRYIQSILDAK
ncbi:MAG: helix-turn-helix domain-containing protein [Oscillospiraceae bacterium]|nr:helix-turn-helix domain-containing protein [Oscillospiraceae bacterium]